MKTKPLIISVAPNGSTKTKADHPKIPLTPQELAIDAEQCADNGASLIHIHVRNKQGGHLLDSSAYRQSINAINKTVGNRVVVQVSTEGRGIYTPEEQMVMVRELRPQAITLELTRMLAKKSLEKEILNFLNWLVAEKILTQFIVYSPRELTFFLKLHKAGKIPFAMPSILYVLGHYSTNTIGEPDLLIDYISQARGANLEWSVCAFGKNEFLCAMSAIVFGGHARIGFENNHQLPDGMPAKNNAQLVNNLANSVNTIGRKIANKSQVIGLYEGGD